MSTTGTLPPQEPEPTPEKTGAGLGGWAFAHREFFTSLTGGLAFRNFARTLTAIAPYVAVNVGVQHFFARTVGRGMNFGKWLTPVMKHEIVQQTAAIALSFTTFRTVSKVWNKNYDRIFGAKSADEASNAIASLPAHIVTDAACIIPSELAATSLSAGILASVRTGLKIREEAGSQKDNWGQFKSRYVNDWLANAAGYIPFFEATDRLYSGFVQSDDHHNGVYHDGALPNPGNSVMTRDSAARLVFRNGTAVLLAAVPFIATQRYANYKTGGYEPKKNSYLKDVAHGLASWEIPFAIFTTGIELWQKKYDELFQKLEDKYAGKTL